MAVPPRRPRHRPLQPASRRRWPPARPQSTADSPAAAASRPSNAGGPGRPGSDRPDRRYQAAGPLAAARSSRAAPRWELRRWPSARSTRPTRSTSSGGSSTTRRPRSPKRSRKHGPRPSRPKRARAGKPHDRRAAKAKLREARTAINNRQFEQAEAIASRSRAGDCPTGFSRTTPTRLRPRPVRLRRRDKIRNTPPREQSSQGVYDMMVQESRQLISVGKLDEAEAKARQAQRMNVVPPLTADRAESVLHEIAMARAQAKRHRAAIAYDAPGPANRTERPRAWSPSAKPTSCWPRETRPRRAAKFVEADRLSAAERRAAPVPAGIELTPQADPAVRQSSATEPGPRAARTWRRRLTTRSRSSQARRRPRPQPAASGCRRGACRLRAGVRRAVALAAARRRCQNRQRQARGESAAMQLLARSPGALQERQLPGRQAARRRRPRTASSASTPRPTS